MLYEIYGVSSIYVKTKPRHEVYEYFGYNSHHNYAAGAPYSWNWYTYNILLSHIERVRVSKDAWFIEDESVLNKLYANIALLWLVTNSKFWSL